MTICKFEPITHAKIVRINIHDADEDDGDVFNASYIIRRIQDLPQGQLRTWLEKAG